MQIENIEGSLISPSQATGHLVSDSVGNPAETKPAGVIDFWLGTEEIQSIIMTCDILNSMELWFVNPKWYGF